MRLEFLILHQNYFMKCQVNVYLLNALFSQKLADESNNGKEDADNRKFLWEDELAITTEVKSVIEHSDVSFPLQGVMPDGEEFSIDVRGMRLVQISSVDGPDVYVGASESMIDRLEVEKKEGDFSIRLYLKDDEPYANPIPGIYIASKEFPKELIR